jgi:hypothetical protein
MSSRHWITLAVLTLTVGACKDDPTRPAHEVELDRVRDMTVRYADPAQAIADGYADIDVVMPNMGHHYLKQSILDERFEVEKPEILVYANEGGRLRLVAVEYAVPLDKAANAPAGFTGSNDSWDRNTTFQLWTLHAWVHRDNPAGVFSPTNSRVP